MKSNEAAFSLGVRLLSVCWNESLMNKNPCIYLEAVTVLTTGLLSVGHYRTNPVRPDHVLLQHNADRTPDGVSLREMIGLLVPMFEQDWTEWPGQCADEPVRHAFAVLFYSHNVLSFDFYTEQYVTSMMEWQKRGPECEVTGYGTNPLCPESATPVTDYPLSKEEVRLLALHWAKLNYANSTFAALRKPVRGEEDRLTRYAQGRLQAAAEVLGQDELAAVLTEAQQPIVEKLGAEGLGAFGNGTTQMSLT